MRAVIHGDDFTLLGYADLDWVRQEIDNVFHLKFGGRLGPETRDDKHIGVLDIVVRGRSEARGDCSNGSNTQGGVKFIGCAKRLSKEKRG